MRTAATKVARILADAGYTAYFVGGCVRDRLMGYPVKDMDIATSATPDEVMKLFPGAGEVGVSFGVVLAHMDGYVFEVATFRKDGEYADGRRPESVCFTDAQEDAARRDFTMNGLFEDPFSDPPGRIVDYVGGMADLRDGLLRAIGEPDRRFAEDSLRLMRAVRFAVTRQVRVEETTWRSIRSNAALLACIAPERIQMELNKILLSAHRRRGIEMLVETGLMRHIIPEIYALIGCEQPPQWHPEGDVFIHTMLMLEMLGQDGRPVSLELALAALLHDIGKPACFEREPTGRIRFSGHDKEGAAMTAEILRRLKYSNDTVETVTAMVERHMRFMNVQKMKKSTLRRFMASAFFEDELELHRVDCLSSNGLTDNWLYVRNAKMDYVEEPFLPPPLVGGRDLIALGFTPGPKFKEWITCVQDAQLEGEVRTRRQALLKLGEITAVEQNTLAEYLEKLAL